MLLGAAGAGLAARQLASSPPTARELAVAPSWLLVALALGLSLGVLVPASRLSAPLSVALSMTLLHVLAEAVFFRVYLDRALVRALGGIAAPVAIGGLAFALHAMTYAGPWQGQARLEAAAALFAFALFQGSALSLVHHLSRSFVPPVVCHLTTNVVMLVLATR